MNRRFTSRVVPMQRVPAGVCAAIACALFVSGCQPAMTTSRTADTASAPAGTTADWPLTFSHHQFGVVCFDTRRCAVDYNGFSFGNPEPTPPLASLSPEQYARATTASYGPVARTAPPAKVVWQSRDGTELSAEVDLAALFRDGLVRHRVAREDIPEGVSIGSTHILLEIDDRTINVLTRTMIPTREPQIPGNRFSTFRDDLIKVDSKRY
jgi:hypothetical protein